MKKRIISLLLCLCMVFSLLPTAVLAADSEDPDASAGSGQVMQQKPEDSNDQSDSGDQEDLGDQAGQNDLKNSENSDDLNDSDDSAIPAMVAEGGEGATTAAVPELENPATKGTSGGIDWKVENGTLTISPSSNPESDDYTEGQMVVNYGTLTKKAPDDADYIAALTEAGYTPGSNGHFYYPGTVTWVSDSPWKFLSEEITKVVVEDGVTSIAARAFRLPNVTEVSIPASVESIGNLVFEACEKLTTVHWDGEWTDHDSMSMPFNGFSRCSRLGEGCELTEWMPACFYVNATSDSIEGTQFTVNFEELNKRLRNETATETATYPLAMFRSVLNIPSATLTSQLNVKYIFEYSGIRSVTIADDQTSIAEAAFRGCKDLTSVTIPASVAVIHTRAFADSGLKNITFSGSTSPTFGYFAFENVTLESVTLDENMGITEATKIIGELTKAGAITDSTKIAPAKFANYKAEDVVVDGAEGKAINNQSYPFVKNLTINGAYTSAASAFGNSNWGQETLENLTIHAPGENVTINKYAFMRAPLKSVKIEAEELKFTGDAAFLNTMLLTHIDLTGVDNITLDAGDTGDTGGTRTFVINDTKNGGETAPIRYVYFKNAAAYKAMSSQFGGNTNTYYLVTNGGSVISTADGFDAVYCAGYTAEWYEKEDFSGTPYTGTPEKGKTYYAKWIEHIPEPTTADFADQAILVKCDTDDSHNAQLLYSNGTYTISWAGDDRCTLTFDVDSYVATYGQTHEGHTAVEGQTVTKGFSYSNGEWKADDTPRPEIHVACVEKPALPTVEKVGRSGFNFECRSTDVQHNTTNYSPYSEIRRLQVTLDSHPNAYRIISDEAQLGTDPNGKPRYYFEVEVGVTAYIEDFDYHTGREHTLCSDQSETLTLTFWLYDSGSWNQWRAATAYVECAETDIPPVPTRERFYDFTYAIDCVDDASHSTNIRLGNSFGYDRTVYQDEEGDYIQLVLNAESYIRSYNRSQQAAGRTHVRTGDQPASVTAKIYYDKENNRWPVAGTVTTIRVSCIQPPTADEIRQALNMEEPSVTVKCVTTKPAAHEEKAYAPVIGLSANAQAGERVDWFGQTGYLVELDTAAFVNAYAAEEGIGEHSAKTGTPDTLMWVVYWNRAASDNGAWMAEPYEMDDASAAKNSVIEVTHKKPADVHLRIYKSSDLSKAVKDVRYPCSLVEGGTLDLSEIDIAKIYAGEYEIDAGWYDDYRFGLYKDYLAGKRDTKPADMTELEINGNWQNLHLVITDTHKVVYFGSAEDLAAYQNNHDASLIVSSTRARVGAELPTADAPTATRTGYTFKFWSREGQSSDVTGQTVNGWTNLYANWEEIPEPTKENIEFNGKDKVYVKCDIYGTHAELIAYDQGEYDIVPTSDTTANLVFKSATYLVASKYADDHALAAVSDPEVSTQIVFKDGKWQQLKNGPTVQVRCKVTLTYDANAPEDKTVTNMPDPLKVTQTLDEGSTTTFYLSDNIPERDGYVFIGWTSDTTLDVSTIPVALKTKNNGANWKTTTGYPGYTLYAVWQKIPTPDVSEIDFSGKKIYVKCAIYEGAHGEFIDYIPGSYRIDWDGVSPKANLVFTAQSYLDASEFAGDHVLTNATQTEVSTQIVFENGQWTQKTNGPTVWVSCQATLTYNGNKPANASESATVEDVPDAVKQTLTDKETKTTVIALSNETPSLKGYKFLGWADSDDKTAPDYPVENMSDPTKWSITVGYEGKTLYAVWARTYSIYYDGNDGTFTKGGEHFTHVSDNDLTLGEPHTLRENVFTRDHYEFTGWAKTKEGPKDYEGGQTDVTFAESDLNGKSQVKLYAQWKPVEYTVTFNANGGDTTPAEQHVEYNKYATKPEDPKKDGYKFLGWFEDITDENASAFVFETTPITKDITLTAKWAKLYTVVYDGNDGTFTKGGEHFTHVSDNDLTLGEPHTLRENVFTRDHYEFTGWAKTKEGPKDYEGGQTDVTFAESDLNGKSQVKLYAQWKPVEYTVTFNANGGDTTPAEQHVEYNKYATKPEDPKKDGYKFLGWFEDITDENASAFVFETTPITKDITLTAKWEKLYKIVYHGVNGTVESGWLEYGKEYSLRTNDFTNLPHNFLGWATVANSDTVSYTDGEKVTFAKSTVPNDELHLYAVWTHTLTVKYLNKKNDEELDRYEVELANGRSIDVTYPTIKGYRLYERETHHVYTMGDSDVTYIVYYVKRSTGNGGGTYDSPNKTKKTAPALALNTADHFAFINGYPDGSVQPEGNVTRAETAAILYRIMGDDCQSYYKTTSCSYSDVARGDWFNTYVATLENAGVIVDTRTNGKFRPNDAITRAELASMIAQFAGLDSASAAGFNDVGTIYWAAKEIAIAAKMGWINGYPDGSFRPDQNVTRAELMAMVNRALGRTPKSEDDLLSGMKTWSDNANTGAWYYLDVQEATNGHTYTKSGTHETWKKLR